MATYGSIGEFNSTQEDWLLYTECLVQYFLANGISEDGNKRRAILLSSCGTATYQLIHNIVAPDKPTNKTFAELMALVKAHHQPRPSTIMQRFHFHTQTQKPSESVGDIIAQLQKLSGYCEFGDTLQHIFHDQLVCECKHQRLQYKLLAEPDLTFDKAFKVSKVIEATEKEARDLQDIPSMRVHQLGKATATKQNSRRIPNPRPICQMQLDATNVEHNTNQQIVNLKMQNAIFAKRKDILSKCAAAKSKACKEHR